MLPHPQKLLMIAQRKKETKLTSSDSVFTLNSISFIFIILKVFVLNLRQIEKISHFQITILKMKKQKGYHFILAISV
jgi:hypothetical protein